VTPLFKRDHAGNPTDERIVIPDQYNLAEPKKFEVEFKDLLDEFTVVECVGFTDDDFNAFRSTPGQGSPLGKIVDALSDLVRGEPTEATPEEQATALEARAASYLAEAKRIREKDAATGPALVVDEPPAVAAEDADEGPTAP
jgi:hypothetical protein